MDSPQELRTFDSIPTPLARRVLVEVLYGRKTTNIELPGGSLRSVERAVIRATGKALPEAIANEILPGGQGSVGLEVVVSKADLNYLEPDVYEAIGAEPDDAEAGRGELAFLPADRIKGRMLEPRFEVDGEVKEKESHLFGDLPEGSPMPFAPAGTLVFFEHDYDDTSKDLVVDGEKYGPEEELPAGLVGVTEQSKAINSQMSTVIATGPGSGHVEAGDRVVTGKYTDGIQVNGHTWRFLPSEDQITAVIEED